MKFIKTLLPILGIGCLLIYGSSCQSINSQDKTPPTQISEKFVSVEAFKKMTSEEQWKVISPVRRNYLRDLHFNKKMALPPFIKKLVEQYPEMEEAPVSQDERTDAEKMAAQKQKIEQLKQRKKEAEQHKKQLNSEVDQLMHMTPEEQWATFSETRKTYMREHPSHYPDFKAFLNK